MTSHSDRKRRLIDLGLKLEGAWAVGRDPSQSPRDAVLIALEAVASFIESSPELSNRGLAEPFLRTSSALTELALGIVDPLFEPKDLSSRAPMSKKEENVQCCAAATLDALKGLGLSFPEAAEIVGKALATRKLVSNKPNSATPAKQVLGWRNELKKGPPVNPRQQIGDDRWKTYSDLLALNAHKVPIIADAVRAGAISKSDAINRLIQDMHLAILNSEANF